VEDDEDKNLRELLFETIDALVLFKDGNCFPAPFFLATLV
jgi:hypothetical protein